MLRELRAEDADAVAALIVGANPRRGIDADEVRSWLWSSDLGSLTPTREEARSSKCSHIIRNEARRRCEFVWPSGPGGRSRRRRRARLRLESGQATTTARGRHPRSCRWRP